MAVLAPNVEIPVKPLITLDELSRAPLALDLKHFLPDNSPSPDQTAEIRRQIMRASALVANYCHQVLHAAVTVEAGRVPVRADGALAISLRRWPIRSLISVSAGIDPDRVSDLGLTYAEIEPWRVTVPAGFGRRWKPWAVWSYIAGWAVTELAADATQGATTITVTDPVGIIPGQTQLTLDVGPTRETLVPSAVTGNTLTVAPLAAAHQAGAGCSALPEDVRDAVVLLCDSRLRYCDSHALTLTRADRGADDGDDQQRSALLAEARAMLNDYRRVF